MTDKDDNGKVDAASAESSTIVSFNDKVMEMFRAGKISYMQLCQYEMVELGYNPHNPEDVAEYNAFIESLDELQEYDIEFHSEIMFKDEEGDTYSEGIGDEIAAVLECPHCNACHAIYHTNWSAVVCPDCENEIENPF